MTLGAGRAAMMAAEVAMPREPSVSVRIHRRLLEDVKRAAGRSGKTLTEYLSDAAEAQVQADEAAHFPDGSPQFKSMIRSMYTRMQERGFDLPPFPDDIP